MAALVIINFAVIYSPFKMDLVNCQGMYSDGLKVFTDLHLLHSTLIVF
jgi:hypothetical protein